MSNNVVELVVSLKDELTQPLKGLTGTIGGLTRSLGALAAPLAAAFSFGKIIEETKEAQDALAQLTVAYQNSAQAARRSKADILDFSDAAQRNSIFSDESVTKAQSALLRFSRINKDVFDRARQDVLDVASALGVDLSSAAFSVGRALEVPSQGIRELRSLGVIFTESQRKLIQSLEDTGQRAKAQAIILDELEKRYSGAAETARATLGGALAGLKNAFGDLFESSDKGANATADGINKISEVIGDPQFKSNIQSLTGELLSFVGAFANVVATSISGLQNLGQYAKGAYDAVTKVPTALDALYDKQNNLGASLRAALEEQEGIARNRVNDPRRSRELAEQVKQLREAMVSVSGELNSARQGAGRPQGAGSRQRSRPGTGPAFVSDDELAAQDDADNSRITEALVTQRKTELIGLAKLLDDFEKDTRSTEDKIYQDYRDTVAKIQELVNSGALDADKAIKRIADARLKYEDSVQIELIDVNKIEAQKVVVTKVLSEQQQAVNKFVDTLQDGLTNLAQSGQITGRAILKYLVSSFEAQELKDAIADVGRYLRSSLGGASGSSSTGSLIGSIINGIFGARSGSTSANSGVGELTNVTRGYAAGGGSMSGPRVVGEDGPELDTGGGNIMNRRQLQFAMGGGAGGITIHQGDVNVTTNATDPAAVAALVSIEVQRNSRKLTEDLNRRLKDTYGRALR